MNNQVKICSKIKFFSEEDAREELIRIVENNYHKRKSPHRTYRCPICSNKEVKVWHLTSKIDVKEYQ